MLRIINLNFNYFILCFWRWLLNIWSSWLLFNILDISTRCVLGLIIFYFMSLSSRRLWWDRWGWGFIIRFHFLFWRFYLEIFLTLRILDQYSLTWILNSFQIQLGYDFRISDKHVRFSFNLLLIAFRLFLNCLLFNILNWSLLLNLFPFLNYLWVILF